MASRKPAILLLDLVLNKLNGVRNLRAIQDLSPSTKIILIARIPCEREAAEAVNAGAKGYCCVDINPAVLTKVVDVVQKGEIWLGHKVFARIIKELASRAESQRKKVHSCGGNNLDLLTSRESQIASLVGDGDSNKEIASRLNISERTVKAHLTAVFYKIGISDRLRLGLIMAIHR